MADSVAKCTTAGLNTLEPECVTTNSRVSDLHYTEVPLIKTETDPSPINTGDLKTESLDFTDLAHVTQLHPDQFKIETTDGDCIRAECISVLPGIKCCGINSDDVKVESSEVSVSDVKIVFNGAGVDEKSQSKPLQSTEKRPYKCNQCEKRFTWKVHLNSHLERHLNEKPFSCDQCGKSFAWHCQLKSHQVIHTGEKPYTCDQCGMCFRFTSNLYAHKKTHSGEKLFKCDQCGKSFCSEASLYSHAKNHTDGKPHKCIQCDKRFSWKHNLKSHQIIHTGEKPYTCSQCGKSFSFKSNLRMHEKIHSDEKPYKCNQCSRSFSRKSLLKSHQRIHTKALQM
ncbi:hypothetical protein GJAV_G00086760 [Gymnothorax javanicus]|nr:hypothetical protein GJAV_G00086760 [Gymnothorax javanicus]